MARTSVSVLSGQTLAADSERALAPTKVDLSGQTWTAFTLSATITTGSSEPTQGEIVSIKYVTTASSITNTSAPTLLYKSAKIFNIIVHSTASTALVTVSKENILDGNYLYVWVDHDNLGQAITLDLSVVDASN